MKVDGKVYTFREALEQDVVEAANYASYHWTNSKHKITSTDEAETHIKSLLHGALSRNKFAEAAVILWGKKLFTPEPHFVDLVWGALLSSSEVLVQGAGAVGKSYNIAILYLLKFAQDPRWTCIKVLSVTQKHAKTNIFAHMKNLHQQSIIGLPGEVLSDIIDVGDDKQGIQLSAIPQGEDGSGRLRGFHPVPRPNTHPQFGNLSRVFALLDECEEIPGGVWEDIDNMLSTKFDIEHVQVAGATNPKNRNSKVGLLCEPEGGWGTVCIDGSERWKSKRGWDIVRLDGAECENVKQKRIVYEGLLSWEGYKRLLLAGDKDPTYYTMGRGWFPEDTVELTVIPSSFIDRAKREYVFAGPTVFCGALDVALEGGDAPIFTVGKFGEVIGDNIEGMYEKPKFGVQVEQQIRFKNGDTVQIVNQTRDAAKALSIGHEWLAVDCTGNGAGVHDLLKLVYGPSVLGVNYGMAATDRRVLDDDTRLANEMYHKIVTELFFSMRKYIEFGYLMFSETVNMDMLVKELTTRKFKQHGKGLVLVESKKEYMKRTLNPSPDHADSLAILVHLIRMRSKHRAAMLVNAPQSKHQMSYEPGHVDVAGFKSFDD